MAKKEYTNGDVTVIWQPGLCTHSAKCVHGLGKVFDPNRKPWIDTSQATSDEITNQVNQCPSGALSMKGGDSEGQTEAIQVQLMPGGPLVLRGVCEVIDEAGLPEKKKNVAFCRCAKSANFPYCDGSHKEQ